MAGDCFRRPGVACMGRDWKTAPDLTLLPELERIPNVLVLTRKKNEVVVIDGGILITVVELKGDRVRLGFSAPENVKIHRAEVAAQIAKELQNESND